MTLGEKLKNARLAAGLSQRELCAGVITRNMLSQIEHGTARPSMDTLRALAGRLEKPMGFFLEEESASCPNQAVVERARAAWQAGDWEGTLRCLELFREPDSLLEGERRTLTALALLNLGERAAKDGRRVYALELLRRAGEISVPYFEETLRTRRLIALTRLGEPVEEDFPELDGELMARAAQALSRGDGDSAGRLLDAVKRRQGGAWHSLRGEAYLLAGDYARAAEHLRRGEEAFPDRVLPLLERCYRELGDYRLAYEYACKQRSREGRG